jgi:hypothetical protein
VTAARRRRSRPARHVAAPHRPWTGRRNDRGLQHRPARVPLRFTTRHRREDRPCAGSGVDLDRGPIHSSTCPTRCTPRSASGPHGDVGSDPALDPTGAARTQPDRQRRLPGAAAAVSAPLVLRFDAPDFRVDVLNFPFDFVVPAAVPGRVADLRPAFPAFLFSHIAEHRLAVIRSAFVA